MKQKLPICCRNTTKVLYIGHSDHEPELGGWLLLCETCKKHSYGDSVKECVENWGASLEEDE